MHDELNVWIDVLLLAAGYENQEYQIYKDAGAEGDDFMVLSRLRGVLREWQLSDAKRKG
jgi:hypothetical protein